MRRIVLYLLLLALTVLNYALYKRGLSTDQNLGDSSGAQVAANASNPSSPANLSQGKRGTRSAGEVSMRQPSIIDSLTALSMKGTVVNVYAPLVSTLALSTRDKKALYALLVQRDQVLEIIYRNGPTGQSIDDLNAIEDQLRALLRPEHYSILDRCMLVPAELLQVGTDYAPYLELENEPMTGAQRLALAEAVRKYITSPAEQGSSVGEFVGYFTQAIDGATGLSAPQRKLVQELRGALSDKQITLLSSRLRSETEKARAYEKR